MSSKNKLHGVGVALVTPFDSDGKVDFVGLEKLLEHVSPHLDYLVVNGTTAESPTLSASERIAILEFVQQNNPSKLPIVFGMGANNTQALISEIQQANFDGIDAILSVSPYYSKPTQEGIFQHYKVVADTSPVPIILYNVPPRTGSKMDAETTIRLSNHQNIVAIKEASGDLVQCATIRKQAPKDFLLISGDDLLTIPLVSLGGSGVISVIANAFPEQFASYVNHTLNGDFAKANELSHSLLEINQLLFAEGNPAGVKLALEIQGICQSQVRLPLVKGSEKLRKEIEEKMKTELGMN
ncbi:MAG: 4-hydroxy-tetrahydrodipicolinate synthase [Bacteroidia bacterium]|jgi:4-hydroxy-tetrahydrodipicolinate synthase